MTVTYHRAADRVPIRERFKEVVIMAVSLSKKDYQAALSLSAEERYDYFVEQVGASGEIWSLANKDGWVAFSSEGDACLPVWPHPDFARAWVRDDWSDCKPQSIRLDAWIERWLPGMEADGTLILVFPSEEEEGIVVSPGELEESLVG